MMMLVVWEVIGQLNLMIFWAFLLTFLSLLPLFCNFLNNCSPPFILSEAEEEEEEEEIVIIEPEQTEVSVSESLGRDISSPVSSKGALEAVVSKQSLAESRSVSIPPSQISEPAGDAEKV